ncbi:MAG TPA: LuxR C-terminal-related transcriptional regulator [Pontiella sp.]
MPKPDAWEVLRYLAEGMLKKEIATILGLADHQIIYHVRNLYKKLHTNTLGAAKAIRKGYI